MKVFSKRLRLRVALIMAISLLCAQFAAQAHAYSHLKPGTDVAHQLAAGGRLCSDCLAATPLLSAAGSPSQPVFLAAPGVAPTLELVIQSQIGGRFPAAFRSRAPPFSR